MHDLKMTICFIGMPGSGKTTLAQLMGDHFNLPVIDLDYYIEHELKTSISSLWKNEGEQVFRCIERFYLLKVLSSNPVLLSSGGGTPCFFDNMSFINSFTFSIYLKLDSPQLDDKMNLSNRPAFIGKQNPDLRWNELLQQRSSSYERANLILNSYNVEPNVFEAVNKNCLYKGIITTK